MSPAVSSLLRRLVSLAAGASAAPIVNGAMHSADVSIPNDHTLSVRAEKGKLGKLIFGRARSGARVLASHRSHSSHSSHYSGSSGGGSYPYVDPTPPKSPPAKRTKRAAPSADQPSSPEGTTQDAVRRKLPKIRSHWPAEALLTQETQFNFYDGDKVIGVITLNAGTKVRIVAIKLEHVIVRISDNESPLPLENTDIVERMGGAEKILAYPDDETSTAGNSAGT